MTESAYTVPGAPRLALLSDLHGRPYREFIRSVQDFRPEMICITGKTEERLKKPYRIRLRCI
jgi:hypothetical protein